MLNCLPSSLRLQLPCASRLAAEWQQLQLHSRSAAATQTAAPQQDSRSGSTASMRRSCYCRVVLLVALAACCASSCAAARSEPPSAPARPHTWAHFGISGYTFTGYWNEQQFVCHVWLRLACLNASSSAARMVLALHDTPFLRVSPGGVHATTPPELLAPGSNGNSVLPQLWFQAAQDDAVVRVRSNPYEDLVRNASDAAVLTASAVLPAGAAFTLRMEGSERVHEVPQACGPVQHALFGNQSAWLGLVDSTTVADVTAAPGRARRRQHDRGGGSSVDGAGSSSSSDGSSSSSSSDGTDAISVQPSQQPQEEPGGGQPATASSAMRQFARTLLSRLARSAVSNRISSYLHLEDDYAQDGSSSSVGGGGGAVSADTAAAATMEWTPLVSAAGAAQSAAWRRASGGAASAVAGEQGMDRPYDDRTVDGAAPLPLPDSAIPVEHVVVGDYVPPPAPAPASNSSGSGNKGAPAGSSDLSDLSRGDVLRYLVLQHLQHHRHVGFAGSIMVVMQHTADMLLQSAQIRRAVARKRLVLVLWELGLEPRASHFMQVPAYNLLRLAAWGANATLGFWDLDEYLVLPRHRSIGHEIYGDDGCMKGTLEAGPEAIVPSMWARANGWDSSPELRGWLRHGSWPRAVQGMDYVMWPYSFCDGSCKALVDPNSDMHFQVHQHVRPPPRTAVWPLSWRCGYVLHFYRLWSLRTPALMAGMGYADTPDKKALPGVPLLLEDVLPPSTIARLAHAARLYAHMLALNPSLSQAGADAARGGEPAADSRF